MLPVVNNSTAGVQRCIHCAFQARKLAIQVQRFRTSARQAALAKPLARQRDQAVLFPDQKPTSVARKHSDGGREYGRARERDTTRDRPETSSFGKHKYTSVTRKHSIDGRGYGRAGEQSTLKNRSESRPIGKDRTSPRTTMHWRSREEWPEVLQQALRDVKEELASAPFVQRLADEREETVGAVFKQEWRKFTGLLNTSGSDTSRPFFGNDKEEQPKANIRADLRQTWEKHKLRGLKTRVKFLFCDQVVGGRFSSENIRTQKTLADIRYPSEWYPLTRQQQRVIHLHIGPTNSGKTYQALKRLESAEKLSVYAGPLRLLAHEVYSRMNAKGISAILTTGDDRRAPPGLDHADDIRVNACTVEMLPLNAPLEVCVIDEIQMLGDSQRGWAWTQALLGARASELHLCGEERALPLVQQICALTGEQVHVHRYERLSPLAMDKKSLGGDLKLLRKGDCLIVFSVMGIHAMRKAIETHTGRKAAIVYGSLPSETRAQQAKLFNDPDNDYDYLVASDAVGMGLNLAIKRVVFETTIRFDGTRDRPLDMASIKQIAGRAGRYRTAHQANQQALAGQEGNASVDEHKPRQGQQSNVGLVTTLEDIDFPVVEAALASQPPPLKTAGIQAPVQIVERFANYFPPNTPFSYILTKLREVCSVGKRFHHCDAPDIQYVADLIEPVRNLTIADRYIIGQVPKFKDSLGTMETLVPALARIIAEQGNGSLTEIKEVPLEILDNDTASTRDYLFNLEALHKSLVLYLWLAYRFAGIFRTRDLAFHVRELTEAKIERVMKEMSYGNHNKIVKARQQKQRVEQMATAAVLEHREEYQDPADTVALVADADEDALQDESTLGEDYASSAEDTADPDELLPEAQDHFEEGDVAQQAS